MTPRALLFQLLLGLCLLFTTSCQNGSSADEVGAIQADRNGSPPGDRRGPPPGDRQRPPRGGSPIQTKSLEETGGYKIGEVATDFQLEDVDGNMISLAGFTNAKGYIITFTCNECPFAKMYEDRLVALHNKWAPQGYPVIAINANGGEGPESLAAMNDRAKEKSFPFPYVLDAEQAIYTQYGAVRTPHVFVLDADLSVQYIGAIDDNARAENEVKTSYVDDALTALIEGKTPEVTYTKAIGCPIKKHS